jgi:hypothetical protein
VNAEPKEDPRDEIIFSASYSRPRALLGFVVLMLPGLLFFVLGCLAVLFGEYGAAAFFLSLSLPVLIFGIEESFSERVIFYRDRVTKVWQGFGSRTVHYSNAQVASPQANSIWFADYGLRETGPNAKWLQFPPFYINLSHFSPDDRGRIQTTIGYLTGKQIDLLRPIPIVKYSLDEEATYPAALDPTQKEFDRISMIGAAAAYLLPAAVLICCS